jgi:hypothetical protein
MTPVPRPQRVLYDELYNSPAAKARDDFLAKRRVKASGPQ